MKEENVNPSSNGNFKPEPMNLSQLAAAYNVNLRTIQRWLNPYHDLIGERCGHLYTPRQVMVIVKYLGPMPNWKHG